MTTDAIVALGDVSHRYGSVAALANVSVAIPAGRMAGLIGPDGVGKSTLLALASGVRRIQSGTVIALGGDMADRRHRQNCGARIAYMPQGLGRNLYPTLSVQENLDFFGRLFAQRADERAWRIAELARATALDPFLDRPAGKLSGGMKQKLALCCALIHDPDLLILDEPTTGVDPLSRRQFWELVNRMRARRPGMSVIVATAYMEEAERFDWLAAMDGGRVIAAGAPDEIKAQAGATSLEAAFINLLPDEKRASHVPVVLPPMQAAEGAPSIEAEGLTKRFGKFVAVDHVSFKIERGEIFGFLGSNGCGKTTTMKMLTGLLPASEGTARLLGKPIDAQDIATRLQVGYMSQSFSLYRELTIRQNLVLHARLYGLAAAEIPPRVTALLARFELEPVADSLPESQPLGIRQRLQLAVALIHRPTVLILDEPTSGVDPIARDAFWRDLIALSRDDHVTIFISTHFMNEAARCDRISLMHAGKVLAVGAPTALMREQSATTLEQAFIAYLEQAGSQRDRQPEVSPDGRATRTSTPAPRKSLFDIGRLWACASRETMELLRDPVRITFALLGPLLLMLTFGYGVSLDVEHLTWAAFDQDRTVESRALLDGFQGSRYFDERPPIASTAELERRFRSGELRLAVEIPPGFGRDLLRGRAPEVGVWIDGAMPFRAETTRGYVTGVALRHLADMRAAGIALATIETRFRYNQEFKSVFAIVPGVIMLMLVLIPAMMTALGVVREKETGSISNFRSTPVTAPEFLIGKQLPYLALGLISFGVLMLIAGAVFGVNVRGSLPALLLGAALYLAAATGFGLVISTFTRTQVAAIFATAVVSMIPAVNFSGLLTPVSGLSGGGRLLGLAFPAAWFQEVSVGAFTKGLGFSELWFNQLVLAVFALAFIGASCVALRKQEA